MYNTDLDLKKYYHEKKFLRFIITAINTNKHCIAIHFFYFSLLEKKKKKTIEQITHVCMYIVYIYFIMKLCLNLSVEKNNLEFLLQCESSTPKSGGFAIFKC